MTLDEVVDSFCDADSPAYIPPTMRSLCAHAFYSNNGSSAAVTRIGGEPIEWAMAALIGDMRKTCTELGLDFESIIAISAPVKAATHAGPSRVQ